MPYKQRASAYSKQSSRTAIVRLRTFVPPSTNPKKVLTAPHVLGKHSYPDRTAYSLHLPNPDNLGTWLGPPVTRFALPSSKAHPSNTLTNYVNTPTAPSGPRALWHQHHTPTPLVTTRTQQHATNHSPRSLLRT